MAVSVRSGEGIDTLIQELELRLAGWRMQGEYRIPIDASALLAEIHRAGHVLELRYEGDDALIRAHVPPDLSARLVPYALK